MALFSRVLGGGRVVARGGATWRSFSAASGGVVLGFGIATLGPTVAIAMPKKVEPSRAGVYVMFLIRALSAGLSPVN